MGDNKTYVYMKSFFRKHGDQNWYTCYVLSVLIKFSDFPLPRFVAFNGFLIEQCKYQWA